MYGILKLLTWMQKWEGNLGTISDFFCGSGHVIPKHVIVSIILMDWDTIHARFQFVITRYIWAIDTYALHGFKIDAPWIRINKTINW